MKHLFIFLVVFVGTFFPLASQNILGVAAGSGRVNSPEDWSHLYSVGCFWDYAGRPQQFGGIFRVHAHLFYSHSEPWDFSSKSALDFLFYADVLLKSKHFLGNRISAHVFPGLDSQRVQYDFGITYRGVLDDFLFSLSRVFMEHAYQSSLSHDAYRLGIEYEKNEGRFGVLVFLNGFFHEKDFLFDFEYGCHFHWQIFSPLGVRFVYSSLVVPQQQDSHFKISQGKVVFLFSSEF